MSKLQSNETTGEERVNPSGSQKYRCSKCKTVYTPEPSPNGYPEETRLLAISMCNSYHAIGRILKVNLQSVINWSKPILLTYRLPQCPKSQKPQNRMNSTPSLVRKNEVYLRNVVDLATRCVLSWDVVMERTSEALQACLERAPQAKQYYSHAFRVYEALF